LLQLYLYILGVGEGGILFYLCPSVQDIFRRIFVTKYQISVINRCWEKCDEKCAYMFNVYKDQLSRQTGSRNLTGPKTLPTIWYTYNIFLSNYWWQKSDIWSQASYRYPISWEAFFDPSDSYFLFAKIYCIHMIYFSNWHKSTKV
jgi:hypothetical protein